MHDVWIEPRSDASVSPLWLTSARVRKGIRAMLQHDGCLVERRRLGREAENLLRTFKRELVAAEIAIRSPESESHTYHTTNWLIIHFVDSHLQPFLQRRYNSLLALQFRWGNPFIADFRWTSHVQSAAEVAAKITHTTQGHNFVFIHNTVSTRPTIISERAHESDEDSGGESEVEIVDENLLGIMADDDDGDAQLNNVDDVMPECEAQLLRIIEGDDVEVISYSIDLQIVNILLQMSGDDLDYLQDLPSAITHTPSAGLEVARSRSATDSFPTLLFDSDTLGRLSNPRKLLDASAINGCTAILYSLFPRGSTAIFSSFDLTRMLDGIPDKHLWRHTKRTEFWTKDFWIIPIHRPHEVHWTVASVCISQKTIHVFDSLAVEESTSQDLRVSLFIVYVLYFGHLLTACVECVPVHSSALYLCPNQLR